MSNLLLSGLKIFLTKSLPAGGQGIPAGGQRPPAFLIVLLTQNCTSHGAHRAPIRWLKATSPLLELEGGAPSVPNIFDINLGALPDGQRPPILHRG